MKKKIILTISPILIASTIVTVTSCSSSNNIFSNLPFSQLVSLFYGDVEIKPSKYVIEKGFTAEKKYFPISTLRNPIICKTFFDGFPEGKEGISVSVEEVVEYKPKEGQMIIKIKYSRDKDENVKDYTIKGFPIVKEPFEKIIDNLYKDVSIYPTEKGAELTAFEFRDPSMITPLYFNGLPTPKEGISLEIISVETYEMRRQIEIYYKYSKDDDSLVRKYTVGGFAKVENLREIVEKLYKDVSITPTEKAKKLTATKENWPIDRITSEYFHGLPTPKEGIKPIVKSVTFDDDLSLKEGVIFIQYTYSKGSQKVDKTYIVKGLKT